MDRYRVMSHAEDVRLKIYGKDLEELFINGAYGISKIIYENIDKKIKLIRGFEKIKLEADDRSSLFINFLNKVLRLSQKENKVYPRAKILKLSPNSLVANIRGVDIDDFDESIKTVRFDESKIEEKNGKLEAVLILET